MCLSHDLFCEQIKDEAYSHLELYYSSLFCLLSVLAKLNNQATLKKCYSL